MPVAIISICSFTFQGCKFSYFCCNETQPLLLLSVKRLFRRGMLIADTTHWVFLAAFCSSFVNLDCFYAEKLRYVTGTTLSASHCFSAFLPLVLQHPLSEFELYQCESHTSQKAYTFLMVHSLSGLLSKHHCSLSYKSHRQLINERHEKNL